MNPVIRPLALAASLEETWSPRVIGEIEGFYLKVARLQGELAWHSHAEEDELFFVLRGALHIELEDSAVDLAEGDLYIVPKGVRHNPVAREECLVLLLEAKSTLHTGTEITARTRSLAEQLRPLGAAPSPEPKPRG